MIIKFNNKKGFSLLELMIVISIISILSASIAQLVSNDISLAKDNVAKEQAKKINEQINFYFADFQRHPRTLNDLVNKKYISKIPDNPISGKLDWEVRYLNVKDKIKKWEKYNPKMKSKRILEVRIPQL